MDSRSCLEHTVKMHEYMYSVCYRAMYNCTSCPCLFSCAFCVIRVEYPRHIIYRNSLLSSWSFYVFHFYWSIFSFVILCVWYQSFMHLCEKAKQIRNIVSSNQWCRVIFCIGLMLMNSLYQAVKWLLWYINLYSQMYV